MELLFDVLLRLANLRVGRRFPLAPHLKAIVGAQYLAVGVAGRLDQFHRPRIMFQMGIKRPQTGVKGYDTQNCIYQRPALLSFQLKSNTQALDFVFFYVIF